MIRTIWKYGLEIADEQVIRLPVGYEILSVDNQLGHLCMWVMLDPKQDELLDVKIRIIGTGHMFDLSSLVHIGTAVVNPFVWHVFVDYTDCDFDFDLIVKDGK